MVKSIAHNLKYSIVKKHSFSECGTEYIFLTIHGDIVYYNRTLSDSFAKLIKPPGKLRWLFDLVHKRSDFDFLIGRNNSKEWISVYRGTSRLVTIIKTREDNLIKIDGADAYKDLMPELYGKRNTSNNFKDDLLSLTDIVANNSSFDRYYNNKKEGYYQNELSRKYGICGTPEDDFVIIDKEAVIGYENQHEKNSILAPLQAHYKGIIKELSESNPKRFGKDLEKRKSVGNELDFVALDKQGNILLIEFKDGSSAAGVYLSPFQIGAYFDLCKLLPRTALDNAIKEMFDQKKKIGLINSDWNMPVLGNIVPVLIISNYNYKSKSKQKYQEVMDFIRARKEKPYLKNIRTYNYTSENGLVPW